MWSRDEVTFPNWFPTLRFQTSLTFELMGLVLNFKYTCSKLLKYSSFTVLSLFHNQEFHTKNSRTTGNLVPRVSPLHDRTGARVRQMKATLFIIRGEDLCKVFLGDIKKAIQTELNEKDRTKDNISFYITKLLLNEIF